MKIRNKKENASYIECLDTVLDQIDLAIDSITYTDCPELNERTIARLREAAEIVALATTVPIFKP